MNWLSLGFWVLTALCLGLGTLWGFSRGLNRAALRMVLVVLCAVLAFCLRGVITNSVWGLMEDLGVIDQIIQELPDGMEGMMDTAKDLVSVVMYPIIFVALFFLLRFLTWAIVFPICKLFIKGAEKRQIAKEVQNGDFASEEEAKQSKKHKGIAKKRKGFGALVGLAQGVVVAICFLMPLGAMVYNVGAMLPEQQANAMVYVSADPSSASGDTSGSGSSDSGSSFDLFEGLPAEMRDMFTGYSNSAIGKFYGEVCSSSFNSIASVKTAEGRITFTGVTQIVVQIPDVMESFEDLGDELGNIDFADPNSLAQLKTVMAKFDTLIAKMPDTARDTISTLVSQVSKNLANNIDTIVGNENPEAAKAAKSFMNAIVETLEDVKFTDIKFENEIDVIIEVSQKVTEMTNQEKVKDEDISALLNIAKDSDLIVPLMNNIDLAEFGVEEIDEENKAQIDRHLTDMLNDNPELEEIIGAMRKLIGIQTAE